jgi:hypothetical protein
MRQFTRSYAPRLTRAQNAFQNPNTFESQRAEVIKVLGDGLYVDGQGVNTITVSVRVTERPGQPSRLTAKDTLATQLEQIAKAGLAFAFTANVSGNPVPYLFATSLEVL